LSNGTIQNPHSQSLCFAILKRPYVLEYSLRLPTLLTNSQNLTPADLSLLRIDQIGCKPINCASSEMIAVSILGQPCRFSVSLRRGLRSTYPSNKWNGCGHRCSLFCFQWLSFTTSVLQLQWWLHHNEASNKKRTRHQDCDWLFRFPSTHLRILSQNGYYVKGYKTKLRDTHGVFILSILQLRRGVRHFSVTPCAYPEYGREPLYGVEDTHRDPSLLPSLPLEDCSAVAVARFKTDCMLGRAFLHPASTWMPHSFGTGTLLKVLLNAHRSKGWNRMVKITVQLLCLLACWLLEHLAAGPSPMSLPSNLTVRECALAPTYLLTNLH
jgi:hypothetical protein